jgi:glycosyltransferase involved in cell wall biosynthesis
VTLKPTLVVVSHGITPYGTHFLARVAAELPEYALRTIYSYEFSNGPWRVPQPASINAVTLGAGEDTGGLGRFWAIRSGWTRYRQLVSEIGAAKPAAVVMFGYGWLAHLLTLGWCFRQRIPVLLWGDSNILADRGSGAKAWIKARVLRWVVARCGAILPCGTLGARYFEKYGARREQISFMPYEPDYSLIEHPPPDVVDALTAQFGLRPGRRRLIYSGRLIAIKRVDLLLEAFERVAAQRPDWDLLIVGDGPDRAELESRVPQRCRNRITWTGFIESPERMLAIYQLGDVLVLPSSSEPWALVVNEATAAGLALVCSDVVGAAAELLRDGVNGRSFKTNDLESLATALLDVTDAVNLPRYRAASPEVLLEWRKIADPVEGLRHALAFCARLEANALC